jgi:Lipocalin-like domain
MTHTIDNLAGTWTLVSASASTASGERGDGPFGPSPTGILIYTREGQMAVMVSYSGRKPLPADPFLATIEERAEAFTTFFGYAGRYTLSGDNVIHHAEISSLQNFVGADLVRLIKFQGAALPWFHHRCRLTEKRKHSNWFGTVYLVAPDWEPTNGSRRSGKIVRSVAFFRFPQV